jgi:hypothetical protein
VLRVLRDVIVRDAGSDELTVIGRDPAAVGESMTLELAQLDAGSNVSVQVIESRPVLVDGAMRHRLRLKRTRSQVPGSDK